MKILAIDHLQRPRYAPRRRSTLIATLVVELSRAKDIILTDIEIREYHDGMLGVDLLRARHENSGRLISESFLCRLVANDFREQILNALCWHIYDNPQDLYTRLGVCLRAHRAREQRRAV